MTTHSAYHGDKLTDSLVGRLQLISIVIVGAAAVAILTYLVW